MLNMTQKGAATVAAVVATIAIAGGTVGTPVAVDTFADQNPDSAIYELERVGESIKGATVEGGPEWQLELAQDRMKEYEHMAKKGKAQKHQNLLEKANKHTSNAAKKSNNVRELQRVRKQTQKQVQVLENLENEVPEHAQKGIEMALTRSRAQKRVMENIENQARNGKIPPGQLKERLENQLNIVEELEDIVENRNLPPGILKEVIEDRELSKDNLNSIIDGEELPPGVLKEILEDQDLSENELNELLEGQNLPPGVRKQILDGDSEDENEDEDESEEGPPGERSKPKDFIHEKRETPGPGPGGPPIDDEDEEDDELENESEEDEKTSDSASGYELMDGEVKLEDTSVSYKINPTNPKGLESSEVVNEIIAAFETWDSYTSVELYSNDVDTTDKSGFNQDQTNVISFAPLEDESRIGLAKVWTEDGEITEFDIVLNTKVEWGIDPDGEGPETIEGFDVRNIVTHEAGHTLGLMDVDGGDYSHLTMYYRSDPGETEKISLENCDINGLQTLYGE